jgi:hypothetical protein
MIRERREQKMLENSGRRQHWQLGTFRAVCQWELLMGGCWEQWEPGNIGGLSTALAGTSGSRETLGSREQWEREKK